MSMRTAWQEQSEQGEAEDKSITSPLSLAITGFAPVTDALQTLTPQINLEQDESDLILVDLGGGRNRLGGSALAQVYGQVGNDCPDLDDPEDLKAFFAVIQGLNAEGQLLAYHDRSDGGLLVTLLEMAFAAHAGLEIKLDWLIDEPAEAVNALFAEELGAVIQVNRRHTEAVLAQFAAAGIETCGVIARPRYDDQVRVTLFEEPLLETTRLLAQRTWTETSYRLQALRDNPECAKSEFDGLLDDRDPGLSSLGRLRRERGRQCAVPQPVPADGGGAARAGCQRPPGDGLGLRPRRLRGHRRAYERYPRGAHRPRAVQGAGGLRRLLLWRRAGRRWRLGQVGALQCACPGAVRRPSSSVTTASRWGSATAAR
jgi:hypothetical protein